MITKKEIEGLGWSVGFVASDGGTLGFINGDKHHSLRYRGDNFILKKENDPSLTEIIIEKADIIINEKGEKDLVCDTLYRGHPKDINELREILKSHNL
jgi:hypothetical protein